MEKVMTLQELEREIQLLKGQIDYDTSKLQQLEKELYILKEHTMAAPPPMAQAMVTGVSMAPPPVAAPQHAHQSQVSKKKFDIENFIGKSSMGVMASVLIFISIIFFAVAILPYITDTIKMITMYAVSTAFIAVGLLLLKKTGKLFYMILSACGMGALYISILMSNIYFKAIGDIVLYLFILVWAVGIAAVAKNSIRTFSIVGNFGIIISVILGTFKCIGADDTAKFTVLMVFFILSAVIYGVANNRFYYSNTISNLIGILFLVLGYSVIDARNPLLFIILVATCLAQFTYITHRQISPYFVFNVLHKWILFIVLGFFIYSHEVLSENTDFRLDNYIFCAAIYLISLLSIWFTKVYYSKIKKADQYKSSLVIQIADIVTITIAALALDIHSSIFVLLVPVVFFVIGYLKADEKYIIATVATLGLSVFINDCMFTGILILAASSVLVGLYHKTYRKNSDSIKAWTSIVIRIAGLQLLKDIFENINLYKDIRGTIVLLILLAIDMTFKYLLSNKKKHKAVVCVADISSVICAMTVTVKLLWFDEGYIYYLTLLIGCIIFMNNVGRFISSRQTMKQIYAMLKLSLYLFIIFTSLEKTTIVLSVAFFVAAIIWVLLGFKIEAKPVRLYGLITAIISMAKLLLIDIQYNSSLGKAAGFFMCGILAFIISFIYNKFEKNSIIGIKEDEQNEHR